MTRVLFVSHTATVSGAELILADAVQPWRGATAFLFEGGDLARLLEERGLVVREARNGAGLAGFRRDSSPLKAFPLVKRLAGLVVELAGAASAHDVVYANSQKAFVLAAVATAVARRPLVWHLHDIIDPVHFGAAQRRLQIWLANRRASMVIVPSRAAAEAFVAQGGRRGLIEIVPNGLALDPDGRDRGAIRTALGLPDVPLVGVFSRLAAWKGQDVVLRAISDLPDVHAVIAGGSLFGEHRYAQRLKGLAVELGIAARVHFLGQRSDVPCLMRAMNAVVHPSVHPEPFGRTLVEAMLVGVPVIATDTGASSEILEDGRAGTLVPPADPKALAAAIAQVLAHPAGLDTQLARATSRARTHYSLGTMQGLVTEHIHRVGRGRHEARLTNSDHTRTEDCPPVSNRPLCVLSVAHPAVQCDSGRLRYDPLAARTDLDLHLLVPKRWHQFGRTMAAETSADSRIQLEIAPICLPKAGPLSWYLHFYPGLRRIVRRLDPDVIHLWEEPWSVVALQACLLKGRAALVLEVDQNIVKRLPPPFEALRRFVLRRTAHVLCRSPDAVAVVRANGYTGPVSYIGYGVDQHLFQAVETAVAAPPGALRIGYVGRLVVEKGLDDALDAMALSTADVRLAIKGEGPHEAQLRQRAAALGLQGRVTFEPWGDATEIASFIRTLDALVLLARTTPQWREQFGRVIIEAQSCGVPVIGADSGAIPSVIGPGGWVVPEADPRSLAHLFDDIAVSPREIAEKGANGRRNVEDRFTFEAVAQSLAEAWKSAGGERHPRSRFGSQGDRRSLSQGSAYRSDP